MLAEAGSDPVLRGQLEPAMANQLTFSKVPGGVVFGMPARFEGDTAGETWTGAAFERGADGWMLRDAAGRALALPREDPSFLSAALAFARDGVHGDWLADLGVGGEVHLAPALVDTTAGMAAVRADLVPLFHLRVPVGAKSIIVDRDVRVLVDGSRLRLEADLEVRFYRPQRTPGGPDLADRVGTIPLACVAGESDGRPDLFGPEGPEIALMAGRLERAAALAGWIGFFRSALAAEVEGLDALGRDLAQSAGSTTVRTPRRIDRADLAAWVSGAMVRPPGEVPDWMREYAERKRAGASR
jgi:hypothetical protein